MKDGKYKPKEANLRMKQDLNDGNPQMWDLTAYRVLEASHHRTGDQWRIYPTYDFTHCLVDSFENISYVRTCLFVVDFLNLSSGTPSAPLNSSLLVNHTNGCVMLWKFTNLDNPSMED